MRLPSSAFVLCLCSVSQTASATSSTYFGGAGNEIVADTLLLDGYLYVTGSTTSLELGGAGVQSDKDAYVARIATDLSAIDYVVLGGDGNDTAMKIAHNPSTGQIVVFGETDDATGFAGEQLGVGGYGDIFVALLATDLTLVRVSWVGGDGMDYATDLAVNTNAAQPQYGTVYISGKTNSDNMPALSGAPQEERAGILDAYVMSLSADLTAVNRSTFLGGAQGSESYVTVSVAPKGDVYLFGVTNSDDFPCTDGSNGTSAALQDTAGGGTDLFLALYDSQLKSLQASTFLGGDGYEEGSTNIGLMFDAATDDVYVIAEARSTDFPTAGSEARLRGFVARIDKTLSTMLTASNIDGSSEVLDAAFHPTTGEIYVVGSAASTLAGTAGGAQETSGGGTGECFLARFSHDLTTLNKATFLGGSDHEFPAALAFNAGATEVLAVGYTTSSDFPGVTGGVQGSFDGGREGFVARFSSDLTAMPRATFLGGALDENLSTVVLDAVHDTILVVGMTESSDYPFTTGTAQTSFGGPRDGFVTLLEPTLAGLPLADLSLAKSGPASVAVGGGVSYTLEVENHGPDTATGVAVADMMPDGLEVSSVEPAAFCSVDPAGPYVDQEHDPVAASTYGIVSDVSHKAQTFVVGLDGALTRVDLFVYRTDEDVSGSLLFDIRATDANGAPLEDDATVLASAVLAPTDVPSDIAFYSVDLSSSPVSVTAGDLLAIVLRAQPESGTGIGNPYMWGGSSTGDPYAAGKYYTRTETLTTWTALEDVGSTVPDLGFRTEITVAFATVSCELGPLDANATTTVAIETTAPGTDTYVDNNAVVAATSLDPNLENNTSSLTTVVGNPQTDNPPENPPARPSGSPDGCDCRSSSPSLLWLALGLAIIGWCRRPARSPRSAPK